MEALIGNKNAEKWTLEPSIDLLTAMLKTLEENEAIVFSGELAEEHKTYRQLIEYLAVKFQSDPTVFNTVKRMNNILETRAVVAGMKSTLNTAMVIFHLKNNHGWKDKSEIEQTVLQPKTDLSKLTPDQLRAAREAKEAARE